MKIASHELATFGLAIFATCAVTLPAQQAHHVNAGSATQRRTAATCPAAAPAPAVPANLPPAPGKVQSAFALRFIDVKPGDGPEAQPGQFYTVHYTGWLAADGTKFDSSLDRNEPITFPQGAHRVIPGWDEGFTGMHVGGKRRIFIPYQLAYGERGRPPVIPPKSDLIFDMELIAASETPPEPPPPPPAPAEPATPPPAPPQPQQPTPPPQPN